MIIVYNVYINYIYIYINYIHVYIYIKLLDITILFIIYFNSINCICSSILNMNMNTNMNEDCYDMQDKGDIQDDGEEGEEGDECCDMRDDSNCDDGNEGETCCDMHDECDMHSDRDRDITMEIESIELNGNYYYAPDFEIMSYDEKCEKCIECAFCKRSLYDYSYNVITDNKSLLNDNKIIIGKCGHMFHKDCMDSWIKCGNSICPIDKVAWEEYRIADHYTSLPIVNKVNKKHNYRFYNVNKYKF